MNKTVIILNPAAGGERAARFKSKIKRLAAGCDILVTTKPGTAGDLARKAVSGGARVVVAAGGDGTVNEVVNGIAGSGAVLGLLPVGTMNVFAMELGVPGNDLSKAWSVITAGHVRRVDLARANGECFAQLGGVGLDAEVVRATPPDSKRALGPVSYILSLLQVCAREGPRLVVSVAGRDPIPCRFVLVGNGRHYGGPLVLFKEAKLDDGLLDAVVFKNQSPWDVLRYFQAVLFGNHPDLPDVEYLQSPSIRVSGPKGVPFELDGELAGTLPCEFSVEPGALRVFAPADAKSTN